MTISSTAGFTGDARLSTDHGHIALEELTPGTARLVRARAFDRDSGAVTFEPLVRVRRIVTRDAVRVSLADPDTWVICAPETLFAVERRGYVAASHLESGDPLTMDSSWHTHLDPHTPDEPATDAPAPTLVRMVVNGKRIQGKNPRWLFHVEILGSHNLFINGILVHNTLAFDEDGQHGKG